VSFDTSPSGADVYIKRYEAEGDEWQFLGETPLVQKRIPRGYFLWRVEKEGFRTLERAGTESGVFYTRTDFAERWQLVEEATAPAGMVPVPGGTDVGLRITALDHLPGVDLPQFWIDRFEVTNREFQEFADDGGYQKRELWKERFVRDGRELSWEEAIREFRDATGRPGPANWELGRYPEGKADHPVSGVSWFEAAAYAQFAGKHLPTVYHWSKAGGTGFANYVLSRSNIGSRAPGPAPGGTFPGMNTFGAYDMAGNVREWCWNEGRSGKRYILGGAWNEPSYLFTDVNAQSPWDRSETNGFRCVRSASDAVLSEQATGLLLDVFRDYASEQPAADEMFRIYKSLYSYDKTPLRATTESIDATEGEWRLEKISFDAAYGTERVVAYLFLPERSAPPFQTVVYFDGAGAIYDRSFDVADIWPWTDFLVESGRALMFPIYKGTYERGDALNSDYPAETSFYREHAIQWSRDLQRSVDYLETRSDVDRDRLAFYGLSWGASQPQLLAVEDRFKAAILYSGGFYLTKTFPEVDPINFAPRVRLPVLMLNGTSDFFYPLETTQKPLFRLFGTPAPDKRHVVFDAGHVLPRNEVIRETLDWLDRYLGPVK
jgi:formylglycine-generating enzyme required for sulfatase activity/dienelactone hydrolase